MEKEFNLKEERKKLKLPQVMINKILEQDKEFIKLVKELPHVNIVQFNAEVDKLLGDLK